MTIRREHWILVGSLVGIACATVLVTWWRMRPDTIALDEIQSAGEIADAAGCSGPEASGQCYQLVEAVQFLQRAYADKRWPADGMEVVGLDPAALDPELEAVSYDEGFFRGPSVSRYRLLPSGLEITYCCGTLKSCAPGPAACGCNHDCNGE